MTDEALNRRVLVVDDSEAIREDFRKVLTSAGSTEKDLGDARSAFLGTETDEPSGSTEFDVAFAAQGQEGVTKVLQARRAGHPFALAFVDVRMPPGLDGIETIERMWKVQPDLQVVICTAFADYSFEEIVARLGSSDSLLILKKPFEAVEVRQIASAMTHKWSSTRKERKRMVEVRGAELEARELAVSLADSNRALENANRRAEAASQAKSDFLANMSHEIRTPMNAILGYLDLVFDGVETTPEQESYLKTIRSSGEHLLTIIGDVLDLSRIEAGELTLRRTSVGLRGACDEVVAICANDARTKGLELTAEVASDVPECTTSDPLRLRQILLNLVGNAVKFTSSGSVHLTLSRSSSQKYDGASLVFKVVDTGCGIAPNALPNLFAAFTQADGSTTREKGGTGLGLAISRRLARALGGDLSVESELGSGSTFRLELPLNAPAEDPPSPARKAAPAVPHLDAKVLVVEDVPVNQVLIASFLRSAGATVELAENGAVGCEQVHAAIANGAPFDLVLMDMQMPVMDGYDATRALRAAGIETPVVALTAHAVTTDRQKCLDAGCNDYATKPIDRADLVAACARNLAGAPDAALPASGRSSDDESRVRVDAERPDAGRPDSGRD